MFYPYQGNHPQVHESVFVAPGVHVIGNVIVEPHVSLWFNTVIRADNAPIVIGENTNIQDGSVLHNNPMQPLFIERDVTVGHNVILHACTVRQGALIGMGAIVLDEAEVGEYALVAAGTVVPSKKKIPPRTLVMGNPMKIIRELTEDEIQNMVLKPVQSYVRKGAEYKSLL